MIAAIPRWLPLLPLTSLQLVCRPVRCFSLCAPGVIGELCRASLNTPTRNRRCSSEKPRQLSSSQELSPAAPHRSPPAPPPPTGPIPGSITISSSKPTIYSSPLGSISEIESREPSPSMHLLTRQVSTVRAQPSRSISATTTPTRELRTMAAGRPKVLSRRASSNDGSALPPSPPRHWPPPSELQIKAVEPSNRFFR